MPSVSSILGNPITDIVKSAGDIISKFVADPNQKIQAQSELAQLQIGMQSKLLDADVAFAQAQRDSVVQEEKSESWLAANWRPILMLTFTYIIAHNYVIAPIFHAPSVPIPDNMWDLLKLGMTGYIAGRSLEKIAPHVATAFGGKSDSQ